MEQLKKGIIDDEMKAILKQEALSLAEQFK